MARAAFARAVVMVATVVWVAPAVPAQRGAAPGQRGAAPDSPEVQQRLETTRQTAGQDWAETFDFLCTTNGGRANRPDDPEFPPTRVFDNLAVVGRTGTAVWIVTTSEGMVLIDAGYGDQLDSVLLPGMRALGLDPGRVTHVIVGHGHADHFGGAPYFQQRGARVVMGAPDWDLVEAPAPAGRGGPPAPPVAAPARDIGVADGQTLTVGDVTFTFALVPGHTAGSLGVVFPVRAGQQAHTAGLFGGSVLIPGFIPEAGLRQYVASIAHWGAVTRRLGVDVEIQNHPLYDGFTAKLERLRQRATGQPNPFLVGPESYQRFLQVMSGCTEVQLARRAGA
jgi:metallo-beta-lactamase class B